MKRKSLNIQVILLVMIFIIPFAGISQDKKEKKVTVKTISQVDGKTITKDTTFVITGDSSERVSFKRFTRELEPDSAAKVIVNVEVETDGEDGDSKIFLLQDGDNSSVIHWADDGNIIKFITDDGTEKVVDINEIMLKIDENKSKEIEIEMEKLGKSLEGLESERIMLLNNIEDFEALKELEVLKEFDALREMKNIEIRVPEMPDHYQYRFEFSDQASENELRDAGIKNKPDRLILDNIDLNISDGIVKIDFSAKGKIYPKITVYNFYGDKIYSGKPELNNGVYSAVIDLSKKQKGTYYMQIVSKDSSITKKFHL